MEFICAHCNKPIYGIAVILDRTHFLHEDCKEEYEKRILKSKKDIDIFFDALLNPSEPNSLLRKAFKKYKKFVK